jgi:glycosyltransferase involved in cell wall biosynthesis
MNSVAIFSDANSVKDGGGISYTLSFAESLSRHFEVVDLFFKPSMDLNLIRGLYRIGDRITLRNREESKGSRLIRVLNRNLNLLPYSLVVYKTDYIPSIIFHRKFLLMCDFPREPAITAGQKLTKRLANGFITNSEFTKKIVKKLWGVEATVVNPIVDAIKPDRKDNSILSVGRFILHGRSKQQDKMIKAFREMVDEGLEGWTLNLAGFCSDDNVRQTLERMSEGYPIKIHPNVNRQEIEALYATSKVYWHACGVDHDEESDPALMEHFGISVTEALSAGSVPVVVGKGGPKEIIEDGINGLYWFDFDELKSQTKSIIDFPTRLDTLRRNAQISSLKYSRSSFDQAVDRCLSEMGIISR